MRTSFACVSKSRSAVLSESARFFRPNRQILGPPEPPNQHTEKELFLPRRVDLHVDLGSWGGGTHRVPRSNSANCEVIHSLLNGDRSTISLSVASSPLLMLLSLSRHCAPRKDSKSGYASRIPKIPRLVG